MGARRCSQSRRKVSGGKDAFQEAIARNPGTESAQAQLALDSTELGYLDFNLGDNDGARVANEQALAKNIALLGDKNPAVAENLNTLGNIALNEGKVAEADR